MTPASPTLFLLVDGTLDFDQQLEVIVNPEFPIVGIPIIRDLLAIFDRLGYMRVYGPVDDPRVQWNPAAQHGVEKE